MDSIKVHRGWLLLEMMIALAIVGVIVPSLGAFYFKGHRHGVLCEQILVKQTELGFMEDYIRAELKGVTQVQVGKNTLKCVSPDGAAVTYAFQNGKLRIKNGNANYFDLNTQIKVLGFTSVLRGAHTLVLSLNTERGPVEWVMYLSQ